MTRPAWEQWAKIGIAVQFLALVRTLAEYFRLKHVDGAMLTLAMVDPYITGALICALLCALSVALFFVRRFSLSAIVSAATVVVLLIYKFVTLGVA